MAPSSVGDIIGSAIRVCRAHVPFLISILLGPTLVEIVGQLLLMTSGKLGLGLDKGFNLNEAMATIALSLVGFVITCGADLFLTVRQFAFVRLALGYDATYKSALAAMMKRKWHILSMGVLYYTLVGLWVGFWLVFATVTVAGFGGMDATLIVLIGLLELVMAIFSLYAMFIPMPVILATIACEQLPLKQALDRGFNLAFTNKQRSMGFLTLMCVSYLIFYLVLTGPIQGLYIFEYVRHAIETGKVDHDAPTPLYLETLNCMYYSIINMFVIPICNVSAALFYRDIVMREEGADLIEQVRQIGEVDA